MRKALAIQIELARPQFVTYRAVPIVVRSLAFFARGIPNFMVGHFRLALVTLEWPSEENEGDHLSLLRSDASGFPSR